jgi:D-apiose dehydrogenase
LKFCVLGAGFWAQYQVAAWKQLGIAECVGIYDPDAIRASRFGVATFDDPTKMLAECKPDFVDILTGPGDHAESIRLSIPHTKKIICQKPLADNFELSRTLERECREAGVDLYVHENWRFQKPLQTVARLIQGKRIGSKIFRARFEFNNSFPVFANQPDLQNLDRLIMADLGIHLFDTARYLFGEAKWVFANTTRTDPLLNGENMATVMMEFEKCQTVIFEMAFSAPLKTEAFPQTFLRVEGENGSIELGKDYQISITSTTENVAMRARPVAYPWIDPAYEVVHSSIVDCNAALFQDMFHGVPSGLSASQNLQTLELLEAAYTSAQTNSVVPIARVLVS